MARTSVLRNLFLPDAAQALPLSAAPATIRQEPGDTTKKTPNYDDRQEEFAAVEGGWEQRIPTQTLLRIQWHMHALSACVRAAPVYMTLRTYAMPTIRVYARSSARHCNRAVNSHARDQLQSVNLYLFHFGSNSDAAQRPAGLGPPVSPSSKSVAPHPTTPVPVA